MSRGGRRAPWTTRPELRGTFGMVSSTHWLASAAGMAMLESGGNAFDAAVAAGFTLQVVEPHLHSPGGEVPILFARGDDQRPRVLSGQGPAPMRATPRHFADLGLDMVPGKGLLAATVPGAFGAWMRLLRDHGTRTVREVLDHAIGYAHSGFPLLSRAVLWIADAEETFREHWPTSAAVYLRNDGLPKANTLHRNPALAGTFLRIIAEAEASSRNREAQIDAACQAWYRGFVAEAIEAFAREAHWDASGEVHPGLITAGDLAGYQAVYEEPASLAWSGWTICKTRPWGQGPVFLQQLALLDACRDLREDLTGGAFVHAFIEAAKLAYADRDAFYGDVPDVPLDTLLSPEYTADRARLISAEASLELLPGSPGGREPRLPDFARRAIGAEEDVVAASPHPAVSSPRAKPANTCHVATADRFGNLVAATPSGGFLAHSPVVAGLGFPLSTRLEMAWLDEGLPNTLAPGKRPRTTLSPSLVLRDGEPVLAFGTPGGDQQDQWSLAFFLRVSAGQDLQEAIDQPAWHSLHFVNAMWPHELRLGRVVAESSLGDDTIQDLRRRGHTVRVVDPWLLGRLCAVGRDPMTGVLRAAADRRGAQAYACGR